MTLKELGIRESAVITTVGGEGELRQHFLDMGVIPGAEVTVILSEKLSMMEKPMPQRSSSGCVVKRGVLACATSSMPQPWSMTVMRTLRSSKDFAASTIMPLVPL